MTNTNIHWTDDADLLAEFVLNRLDASTRQKLEAHMDQCNVCKKAVDTELMIAAGARRLGREELKNRLLKSISVSSSKQAPWPRILSAAAILVVITGIGVYNKWFMVNETGIQTEQLGHETDASVPRSEPVEPEMLGKQDQRKTETRVHPDGRFVPPAVRKKELTLREAQPATMDERKDQVTPRGDVSGDLGLNEARSNEFGQRAESQPEGFVQNSEPALQGVTASQNRSTWVQGTILNSSIGVQQEYAAESAAKLRSLAKGSRVQQELKDKDDVSGTTRQYTIEQQPSVALPLFLQQLQHTNTVQALVEQSETGGIRLTLFLDSLLADSELQDATVQQVTEDSILVLIGGQIIGYRIPGAAPFQAAPIK